MIAFLRDSLYIGFGGFFGAVSRFGIGRVGGKIITTFPISTLFVNVTGSFVLAFISYSVLYGKTINPELRNFITIGFIGAYTTMSTFSYETIRLLENREYGLFGLNFVLNTGLCLLAIIAGRELTIVFTK